MAVNVIMPKWGSTMKEGTITKWFKQEGDSVQKGEELFEAETEKLTNKVEATTSGVLFQIVVPAGTCVPVGTIVAILAEPGETPERIEGLKADEAEEVFSAGTERHAPASTETPSKKKFVLSTPAARRLAKELGIDLTLVKGTGPKGRVTEADVNQHHKEGPQPPKITPLAEEIAKQAGLDISTISGTGEQGKITRQDVERALEKRRLEEETGPVKSIPFAGMRKSIADNMFFSLQNTAQLTVFTEVDVTEMVRFRNLIREEFKDDSTVKISYNDIIILAVSRALKRFPVMNSTLIGDEIILHDSVNMGVAVTLSEGLIVPVLRDADKKGLLQIAREGRELVNGAREGTLTVDDVTGGTFTMSNVSMLDVDGFTPILRPPETGILGVGRVKEKPAVYNGDITIRSMMFLSLTFDHRVVDGFPAMSFLETIGRYLQFPTLIMARHDAFIHARF